MPALAHPKREYFCQLMAQGHLSQIDAFEKAGFKRNKSSASTTARRTEVKERIAELKKHYAENTETANAIMAVSSNDPVALLATKSGTPLENQKQEKFARLVAIGGITDGDAYIQAGYNKSPAGASNLKKLDKVTARIAELQDVFDQSPDIKEQFYQRLAQATFRDSVEKNLTPAEQLGITESYILQHLQENLLQAQSDGQYSSANKALELMMKVLDKDKEVKNPDSKKNGGRTGIGTKKTGNVNLNFLMQLSEKMGTDVVKEAVGVPISDIEQELAGELEPEDEDDDATT